MRNVEEYDNMTVADLQAEYTSIAKELNALRNESIARGVYKGRKEVEMLPETMDVKKGSEKMFAGLLKCLHSSVDLGKALRDEIARKNSK